MRKIAFTIVLNGMPFIEWQSKIIPEVFDCWYIIEGATRPNQDTSWCKNIDTKFYNTEMGKYYGCSIDGTSEFIDNLQLQYPEKIKVIRKPADLWNSKTEMCSMIEHEHDCILMQFDVDEIWKIETLKEVLDYAENELTVDGMLFPCNYFVGPNLITYGKNCYGNNPGEWCRLWKIGNILKWRSHEPPRIHNLVNFIRPEFAELKGWKFNHYAYYLESQLKFKENFYGYKNAVNDWKRLQDNTKYPCYLRDYFSWVKDHAQVIKI